MKAKELAEKLLEHPDFEVKSIFVKHFAGNTYPEYHCLKVVGIVDICYSDKEIVLDLT